jgi:hypothetical protein
LQGSGYHRLKPSKKNRIKKPTVGFLVFENWRKIVSMMNYKNISGKRRFGWAGVMAKPMQLVAADVSRRSWGGRANFGWQGPLWTTDQASMVIQNPPTHVGGYGTAVAVNWDATDRESSLSKSLICRTGLLQVVDFPDISTYFQWCLRSPFAVLPQFSKVQIHLTQLVDFQESFG